MNRLLQAGAGARFKRWCSADSAAEAILSYAAREGTDLLALTTRQRGWAARTVFGSVADAVMYQATVPVLVCHATSQHASTIDPVPVR
ncbi:MAG: universal stress protein [Gemmatimonadales bacterium]